jgi:AraC family transcriptional regulator
MDDIEHAAVASCSLAAGDAFAIEMDTLSKLLSGASASVDSDMVAAIRRTEELLGSCRSATQRLVVGRPPFRGGLARWCETRLAAYIEANLDSKITAADLAGVVRLSTGHFFRAFRQSFGEAPLAYVTRQRIRRSQALMLSTRATLEEIALGCGMFDAPHFTRVFRKIVGKNPSVWRRGFAGKAVRRVSASRRPSCPTASTLPLNLQNWHDRDHAPW